MCLTHGRGLNPSGLSWVRLPPLVQHLTDRRQVEVDIHVHDEPSVRIFPDPPAGAAFAPHLPRGGRAGEHEAEPLRAIVSRARGDDHRPPPSLAIARDGLAASPQHRPGDLVERPGQGPVEVRHEPPAGPCGLAEITEQGGRDPGTQPRDRLVDEGRRRRGSLPRTDTSARPSTRARRRAAPCRRSRPGSADPGGPPARKAPAGSRSIRRGRGGRRGIGPGGEDLGPGDHGLDLRELAADVHRGAPGLRLGRHRADDLDPRLGPARGQSVETAARPPVEPIEQELESRRDGLRAVVRHRRPEPGREDQVVARPGRRDVEEAERFLPSSSSSIAWNVSQPRLSPASGSDPSSPAGATTRGDRTTRPRSALQPPGTGSAGSASGSGRGAPRSGTRAPWPGGSTSAGSLGLSSSVVAACSSRGGSIQVGPQPGDEVRQREARPAGRSHAPAGRASACWPACGRPGTRRPAPPRSPTRRAPPRPAAPSAPDP